MCGIAGVFGWRGEAADLRGVLLKMRDALRHRGPDGDGIWVNGDAGLVHTRLAIIDPSPEGAQPMLQGHSALSFNGEIYNFRELSAAATSDTRVLLDQLIKRGPDAIPSLAGMYSFALIHEGGLLLARDPHGIKPLYYAGTPQGFLFASEVRTLLASGCVKRELCPLGLNGFLRTGSVPEPRTIVRDISALPAGHMLTMSRGTSPSIQPTGSTEADPSSLPDALEESLERHLTSDVPVGIFLSGGVDSAAIAALTRHLGGNLAAHSLVFDETEFSEEPLIRETARKLGIHVEYHRLCREEALGGLADFFAAQDQPSIDGFNTFWISRFASRSLKVVLSGVGGDEMFGGYPSFQQVPRWERRAAHWRSFPPRKWAPPIARSLHLPGKLRRVADWAASCDQADASYELVRGIFSRGEAEQIAAAMGWDTADFPVGPADTCALIAEPRSRVSCFESNRYLRNQLLRDSDAMSMAHGLELRTPFVDSRLSRCVSRIPPDERFAPGKQALVRSIPGLRDVVSGRKKRGFTLPIQSWWGDSPLPPGMPRGMDMHHWSRKMAWISLHKYVESQSLTGSR